METATPTRTRLEIILNYLQEKHYLEWANTYGEPGYSDPEKGILFLDWNPISQRIQDYLEEQGYELEWSDEWIIDYEGSEGSTAYRTSPDSYSWVSQIRLTDDGEILTPEHDVEEWLDYAKSTDHNQPHKALPDFITEDQLAEAGYKLYEPEGYPYETGFHQGQTDDPEQVYKNIEEDSNTGDVESVVFQISEQSQFYTKWKAYYKNTEDEEE